MNRAGLVVLSLWIGASCASEGDLGNTSSGNVFSEAVALNCDYGQFAGTAQHGGIPCAEISTMHLVQRIVVDEDAQTRNDDLGFLAVHYSEPLTHGEYVFFVHERGYTSFFTRSTVTWSVEGLRWVAGSLQHLWSFDSKWKPVDALNALGVTNGYEQLFQAALAGTSIYVPGPGGSVIRLDQATGAVQALINPFAGTSFDNDPATIVNSALTVDAAGNVYYTVVAWPPNGAVGSQPRGSWLVRVSPSNVATKAEWHAVATSALGVKQETDLCSYPFIFDEDAGDPPFPPTPDAAPPQFGCGRQRPAVNAAPTIGADGSLIVVTIANNAVRNSYLVAVDPATLAPRWAAPLGGHISDGCGVLIPFDNDDPDACRVGSHVGVDPRINELFSTTDTGIMQNAPVVAPDGTILYGIYSGGYDTNRGHLLHFSETGAAKGLFDYGWDSTPAIWTHDGTFSVVMDDNHFSPVTGDGTGPGLDARVARLSPALAIQNETTVPPNADAVANDFMDGQAAIDVSGNAYVLNATGMVYKISSAGALVGSLDLGVSVEALGSEFSWGKATGQPVLYLSYAGSVWVIGNN